MEHNSTTLNDEVLVLEVSSEDEAVQQAAARWNVPAEDVVLKVIEEGKGFLGLFGRRLKVEARRKEKTPAPAAEPEIEQGGSDFMSLLARVIAAAGLDLEINELPDGTVNLTGPDSRYLLAGRSAEGLKALDYIVNLMARNDGPVPHVRLDCEGFRRKREKDLERIAMDAAKEAMRTRRTVYLPPMSSWERRIVHLTLRESANVETHSIGVEPGRKVAVRLLGSGLRREREGAPERRPGPREERFAPRPRGHHRRGPGRDARRPQGQNSGE